MNSKIHLWVPDLFSTKGGVQAFSRYFLEALSGEVPPETIRVLLENDLPGTVGLESTRYHVNAYGHSSAGLKKLRFASACLAYTWCEQPRLIVSTHLNFGPIGRLARQLYGVPYVLVAHGVDAWHLKRGLRQSAVREADLVLAVSRYTRDSLVQKTGMDPTRVQLLHNTFQPMRFKIAPKPPRLLHKYGLGNHTPVILTVCRLSPMERYKGYDQMIRALPEILLHIPRTRYLVVGEGADRRRVERLAADLGLSDAIIFAGFVEDEELADYYNLADLFAMPSKGEGFGIVYLEALACGKPVLAGNQDGSRDAIADGDLGVLVDPDNTSEIASATIRILRREHPHPNIYCPEMLRQRVTESFGFEVFKRRVVKGLRPYLERKGGRPLEPAV